MTLIFKTFACMKYWFHCTAILPHISWFSLSLQGIGSLCENWVHSLLHWVRLTNTVIEVVVSGHLHITMQSAQIQIHIIPFWQPVFQFTYSRIVWVLMALGQSKGVWEWLPKSVIYLFIFKHSSFQLRKTLRMCKQAIWLTESGTKGTLRVGVLPLTVKRSDTRSRGSGCL